MGSSEQGFRLSPQQRRVWLLQRDGLTSCDSRCAVRIEGDLDLPALRRALDHTVARHEILRTAFRVPAALSVPLQIIEEPAPVALPEVDLQTLAPERRAVCRGEMLAAMARRPFVLERGEGWRATLVRLGPGEHELLLALSAACADPGSLKPLMADLFAAYDRFRPAGRPGEEPEPPLQYADVAEWQNSLLDAEDTAEMVAAWREHWREHGIDARLALPLPLEEREAGAGPFAPREIAVPLARPAADALARLAEAWGTPPSVLVLTAWEAVLRCSTGREETLLGVLYAGRDAEELQTVVGPMARYLPVAPRFGPEVTLRDAAAQVREAVATAERRGEYFSWDHLAGATGATGFPVCFAATPAAWELRVAGLRIAPAWSSAVLDGFALELSLRGTGSDLRLDLRYDPRRFRQEAAVRLADRLAALLDSLVTRPDAPWSEHPPMGERELGVWLELSASPPAPDRGREGRALHEVFEEQADRAPERLALVAGDGRLTFAELDARANRLAHHLRAAGAGPEVPVALCLERSAEAVVALLAVWKAGSFYVPLDPSQPAGRLAYLLEDTAAPLLVTDSRLAPALPGAGEIPGVRTVRIDEEAAVIAARRADRPAGGVGPRNLAYTIYTSGSTGQPKGVQVEHRSALHLLAALEEAVLRPLAGRRPDPLLASLNAPMIFDASVQQLVLLLAGHALCVIPQDVRADGAALLAFLREQGVDLLDCTPSQLRLLVDAGLIDGPAGPGIVLTAGEAVDEPLWQRLAQAERVVSFNLYGPTECSVDATVHRIEPGSTEPTIGRPLAGYEVFLLDAALRPVPPGAPGEICLGGAGLARGYLRRPGLTAERFVPHPFAQRAGERLYRTGDLGRHRLDGRLEFLGRLDHQVKIRGYRIELGEIESVLASHPWVREAVVLARQDMGEQPVLVAYVRLAGDAGADAQRVHGELHGFLRRQLPAYMVPSAFVILDAFPSTPSGKVDRRALPLPSLGRPGLTSDYVAPANPLEQLLAAIWEDLLGVESVGARDDFFELGGHSLLATQVISRVRAALHLEISVRRLFETPTVAGLAAAVEAARAGGATAPPPIVPVPRDRPLPLSFAQQRMWFLQQLEPESAAYNLPLALRLTGHLNVLALQHTLDRVVARHETLRTTFEAIGGEPFQRIEPAGPQPLPLIDLSALPPDLRAAAAGHLAAEEAATPFDLARLPVARLRLLRLAAEDHALLFNLHHVSSDAWSLGVLTREVAELYGAAVAGRAPRLPELPVQYADFAVWQREWLQGEVLASQLAYWRRQLAGAPQVLELPTDRPRPPVQLHRARSRSLRLPAEAAAAAESLSRTTGATPFMTLLAVYAAALQRFAGQETLTVGTPIANRNRAEIEGLVGFFVNTLALRVDLEDDPGLRTLVGRVRETALGAYAHQDLPFERLVEELQPQRDRSRAPLFQALFVFQMAESEAVGLPGLELRPFGAPTPVIRHDLALACTAHPEGLACSLDYDADLFDAATMERLLAVFARLLRDGAAAPDVPVTLLPVLDAGERLQALAADDGGASRLPEGAGLHQLFEAQAARAPEAPALLFEGRTVSYGELDRWANRVARRLLRLGVGTESRVGLLSERTPEALAAMLGILKAGGAYVPLDPESPPERRATIAADAGLAALAVQGGLAAASGDLLPGSTLPTLEVHGDGRGLEGESASPLDLPVLADAAAYVIYTSGSTGSGKGVILPHRGVVRFLHGLAGALRIGPADRLFLFAPLVFDASVLQIFCALGTGAGLAVHRQPRHLAAHEILGYCADQGVTVLDLPAALWRQWVEEVTSRSSEVPGALRAFLTGGESVPVERLRQWAGLFSGRPVSFLSSYGPTETTVTATVFLSGSQSAGEVTGANVPLGRALPGVRVHLLDRLLREVPARVPGELFLGGPGVARGYLGRPDLTAEAFVPDPLGEETGGRLYRTGDLARRRPDGELEFLGRADHQVKIRGFRIETGEIEATLARHPAVRQAVVTVREDRPGDRRLAAYVVGEDEGSEISAEELRRWLAERLPGPMIPSSFTALDRLPVLPSGKVDRAALPAPEEVRAGMAGTVESAAPASPLEEVLALCWAEVLGLPAVGRYDDFFALGGHSLQAARLIGRLRDTFGMDIELRLLFEAPTVAGLAAALTAGDPDHRLRLEEMAAQRRGGEAPPVPGVRIPRRAGDGPAPLSFGQRRLWFLQQLDPANTAYNISEAVRLEGPLDPGALARALAEVTRRHEVLRTVFSPGDGEPVQIVARPAGPVLLLADLAGLRPDLRAAEATRAAARLAAAPFDLARGPVLRASLLRLDAEDHVLALTLHHIAADGWSMGLLLRELVTLYEAFAAAAPSPLPELPLQYSDFAAWQREHLTGETLERHLSYWRQRLAGAPTLLELPTDRPRPAVESFRGGAVPVSVGAAATGALRDLARREGATPFMAALAALGALLHRYSRQGEVVIGAPAANRSRPELGGLIGFFLNTLVLRVDLGGDPSFSHLLGRARETVLGAEAHQDLPFEQLVDALELPRDLSRTPLFQVLLAYQNLPPVSERPGRLHLRPLGVEATTAQFELSFFLVDGEHGINGQITYRSELLDASTARRLARHFEVLLEGAGRHPEAALSALPLLDPAERHQLLAEWNDTAMPRPSGLLLHGLVEAQAARTPDAPALTFEGETLTYAELDARAERLARHLRGLGCGPERRVGVALERSLDLVVGLLGVLKSGAAYVPLDPEYPRERLGFLLEDSRPSAVLTQESLRDRLPVPPGLPVVVAGSLPETSADDGPLAVQDPGDDRLAYVIYTSGSTGRPKGAMGYHRGICNRLLWLQEGAHRLTPADTVVQKTPFSFDVSIWELFGTLTAGARLVLARPGGHRDGAYLTDLIARERVTALHFVPSLLEVFLEEPALDQAPCPSLRLVVASGEALSPELERRFFERFPRGTSLLNLYGPTEASVEVTAWACSAGPGHRAVPIGRPVANTRIHVLDAKLGPVPSGVAGELWIGGVNVGRGYFGRPDLTAERFVPDPHAATPGERLYRTGDLARHRADGAIEYLGRVDHQVKVRGFRIELGEIERVLQEHPGVLQAVVLARAEGAAGQKQLVAYFVAAGTPPAAADLRSFLTERLPAYMVPPVFMALEALPLLTSGKVDRAALPAPGATRSGEAREYVAPRTVEEERLAGVWAQVLRLPRVGVNDNFFELGGDSILSIQIVARARQAGLLLTVRQVFEHQTVAELARHVDTAAAARSEQGAVAGEVPLTPIQRWFFAQRFANLHHFNQALLLEPTEPLAPAALERAVAAVVAHHDALRLRFERTGERDGWRQENAGAEPVPPFHRVDFSALPAPRRRRALEQAAASLHAGFDLATGPLTRLALFETAAGQPGLLLWVAHHLVVDGVSWRVLLEDLEGAYRQEVRGLRPAFPPKTTSFRDWARRLAAHARSAALAAELDHWLDTAGTAVPRLPVDFPAGDENTVGLEASVSFELTAEETADLLQTVPSVYRNRIDEALLSALAMAVAGWTGASRLRVDLEGHGREPLFDDVDTSRTVGWFTSYYPVLLEGDGADPGDSLVRAKERLRAIPERGIGYGLLRHLADGEAALRLAAAPPAEISFNYLGQLDSPATGEASLFRASVASAGPTRSLRSHRTHLLDVSGLVAGGQLRMTLTYGSRVHRRETVERLAAAYADALRRLIQQSRGSEEEVFTPSDFPKARLDARSFNKLAALLSESD